MNTSIGVIIPTLNEEDNIKSCINCLVNQVKKPLEIIVIDNGSTDKTRYITTNLKSHLKRNGIRLKLYYYPYGNQTNAREFGVKKSKCDIIGSLDADARPDKNWVFQISECFKNPSVIGIGGKSHFRNKGKILNLFYISSYYLRLITGLYRIGGGNSAFR